MPVPATIDDLSTTAGSNSPTGGETPKDGDNYIRSLSAFIALLRDRLDGTTSGSTLNSATLDAATLTGVLTLNSTNLKSGTYTPTLTSVSNVTSTTQVACQYLRVGACVTVSGSLYVTPTAAASTGTQIGISLPVASNFANFYEAAGVSSDNNGISGNVAADATNNRAQLEFLNTASGERLVVFHFTYQVI